MCFTNSQWTCRRSTVLIHESWKIVSKAWISPPGRGGQSALRFARLRMEKRHNYVRKVAQHISTPRWVALPHHIFFFSVLSVILLRLRRWQCSCSSPTTSPTAPDSFSPGRLTSRPSSWMPPNVYSCLTDAIATFTTRYVIRLDMKWYSLCLVQVMILMVAVSEYFEITNI